MNELGAGSPSARATFARSPGLIISGAAGLAIAGLIFFCASSLARLFGPLISLPQAAVLVFLVLLLVSLLEVPLMLYALRLLARSNPTGPVLPLANAGFVAFAAVYASAQTLLFGESAFAYVILALSFPRWVCSLWIALTAKSQAKA